MCSVVGTVNSAATMENSIAVPQKVKNKEGPWYTMVWLMVFLSLQWYESKKHSVETIPWIWSFPGLAIFRMILSCDVGQEQRDDFVQPD